MHRKTTLSFCCALTLATLVLASTHKALAQTRLDRATNTTSYKDYTTADGVLKASAKLGDAVWPSTFPGQTESFDGYFIPTSPDVHLAVRSDDGVSLWKDGAQLLSNEGVGQHWPADNSFKDLGGGWVQNVPYRIQMSYKNTAFSGNDADGICLMPYNGTGDTVTVNVEVDGVDEDFEEKDGAFMGVNSAPATATTVETDTDVKGATLKLGGQGETGTWSLAIPAGLKVWQQVGTAWQPVVSGQQSAPVAIPTNIALRVEGVQAGVQELTGNFKLTSPAAAQAIGDKAKVTVVGVQIEKCPATFVPRGGNQDNSVQLKATVTPSTAKGKFRFTLFDTSNEPGYCLNAPSTLPASGEDSVSWKDLQFPAQNGLTLSENNSVAETAADNLNEQTITVKCTDYGAYGKLGVRFILPNETEIVAKETGGTKGYTNIPLDDNDNHVADSMGQDTGPEPAIVLAGAPTTTFAATDDNDNEPIGAYVDGDGISRYEEYRGFFVQGVHTRLSTRKKDVFLRNIDVTDAGTYGYFTEANLTAPTHSLRATEYNDPTRVVNSNSGTAHVVDQQAIRITNGGKNGDKWGLTQVKRLPYVPNNQDFCHVYVDRIKEGVSIVQPGGLNTTDTTIKVDDTGAFVGATTFIRPGELGIIQIDDELVTYSGKTATSFTGCVRGAKGTTAAAHADGANVKFFFQETDFIKRVFAHEAGHMVGINHLSRSDENIMSAPSVAGTEKDINFWVHFEPAGKTSPLGDFRVKK